jgi:(E)-4-hydroxy-3-methyl-but-2-enyl pyrophosphate reductase
MGVRRAMDMTLKSIARHGTKPSTYGPLIHNPQVLELLKEKGVEICRSPASIGSDQPLIIRAHGIPPETREALKKRGVLVIDATCPRVLNVQSIIRRHTKKGGFTIIVGDANHPEVIGLLGYAGEEGIVVSTPEDVEKIPQGKRLCVVAQTSILPDKSMRDFLMPKSTRQFAIQPRIVRVKLKGWLPLWTL